MDAQTTARRAGRLPRGALDRASVVAAALELADRDGLGSITMSRVAAALGASPMSLYRHLRDKQELLDAVADLALSEIPAIARDDRPWRIRLEEWAREARLNALRHPALVEIALENQLYGPGAVSVGLDTIELFTEAGFDADGAIRAFMTLRNHMIGAMVWEISRFRHGGSGFSRQMISSFVRRDTPKDSPLWRLREVLASDPEAQFMFGIESLLDGFEAELRRSRKAAKSKRSAT